MRYGSGGGGAAVDARGGTGARCVRTWHRPAWKRSDGAREPAMALDMDIYLRFDDGNLAGTAAGDECTCLSCSDIVSMNEFHN
mmetsp:Transcript_13649/g.39460  ORF Transcript_13649/g.39460 Transcript_13649/m.39460 type:complete len:83 (-) Transcript_13649:49-297(-)